MIYGNRLVKKWDSYKFQMGDFGYIGLLIRAQIDSGNVIMPEAKIKQEFAEMIAQQTDFDPDSLAKGLMGTSRNIEFNPDFFDNVKPKKTISERIKSFISKIRNKKRMIFQLFFLQKLSSAVLRRKMLRGAQPPPGCCPR